LGERKIITMIQPKIYYHIETDKSNRFKNTIEEALKTVQYFYNKGHTNIKLWKDYEYFKNEIVTELLLKIN